MMDFMHVYTATLYTGLMHDSVEHCQSSLFWCIFCCSVIYES